MNLVATPYLADITSIHADGQSLIDVLPILLLLQPYVPAVQQQKNHDRINTKVEGEKMKNV